MQSIKLAHVVSNLEPVKNNTAAKRVALTPAQDPHDYCRRYTPKFNSGFRQQLCSCAVGLPVPHLILLITVAGDMAPDVQWPVFLGIILAGTLNGPSPSDPQGAHSTTIMQFAVTGGR